MQDIGAPCLRSAPSPCELAKACNKTTVQRPVKQICMCIVAVYGPEAQKPNFLLHGSFRQLWACHNFPFAEVMHTHSANIHLEELTELRGRCRARAEHVQKHWQHYLPALCGICKQPTASSVQEKTTTIKSATTNGVAGGDGALSIRNHGISLAPARAEMAAGYHRTPHHLCLL